jgi:cobyrinic acid a,c-diamide synthase
MQAPRGLVIAAPASGSGKTVITIALVRHLRNAGIRVAAAKVGPDYIDPAFHAAASGREAVNLDGWAMRAATLSGLVDALGRDADLVICEGVMGLFDGVDAEGGGSTAELAERLGWPIVLVLDVKGQAASAAAVLAGCARHRPATAIVGVIFNRVGGTAHRQVLSAACRSATPEIAQLGHVGRDQRLRLPDRHLGLVQAAEQDDLETFLEGAAAAIGEAVAVDRLLQLARPATLAPALPVAPIPPLGQRIAVAQDVAFSFCYPMLLKAWREAGAEILPFSPLTDAGPDAGADAVYLPGGYPELHAGTLAGNARFRRTMQSAVDGGRVVYGECGGYMVLGHGIVDAAGARHAMLGVLPVETSFAERRLHLGYRQVQLLADGPLGRAGAEFRSHEFHYATVLSETASDRLFQASDAGGRRLGCVGARKGRTAGSFIHLIDRAGRD